MKTLNPAEVLIYSDSNYSHAVNYRHLYNFPITLNYGEKHNRKKYILSSGTCDHISLIIDGVYIYVVSQNNGLSYIGLQVINTETQTEEGNVFLNEGDILAEDSFCFGILDMDTKEQIKILTQYL